MKNEQKHFSMPALEVLDEKSTKNKGSHFLILHNDDINTFEFVIDSLIEICEHNLEQAEQCAFITHSKGKCDVKKGTMKKLKPMKNALIERGLKATID